MIQLKIKNKFIFNGLNHKRNTMQNIELSDCIYEHIKDTYYYGLFGDFKLVIDTTTGCFNATKLCIQGGKNYRNWSRLGKSKKMVDYYHKSCRSDLSGSFYGSNQPSKQ